MTIEWIIIPIILIPVILLAVIRERGARRTDVKRVLCRIAGGFLLVSGLLLLFPSFYLLFYGKEGDAGPVVLVVSLTLTAVGHFLSNRAGGRSDPPPGH
ncbi:MAG: hypothetical protein A4E73_00453 [Syntrophaceae bacterium PtaU1.Bin231]|nr:MAG: hypothetical protein A4E73_00453 [Syntrophaceae bacterium PtaU1.Bin231]HOG18023.1 hypothetical protein [Syntrophales bacterium]